MLVAIPQLFVTGGICLGYFTCYGTARLQSAYSWKLPFIMQTVLAVLLLGATTRLPPSPRWLMVQQRREEALESVERLGILRAEAEKDILREPDVAELSRPSNPLQDIILVFRKEYRLRTSLALLILAGIQLSGIDGIVYVSKTSMVTIL